MKKNLLYLFAALLFAFNSCKTEKKEEGPSQMQQVMAIHDEVMPKMGTIGKLVGKLKPMADSLGLDSPQGKAMVDLQEANKAMMDWMQDFGNTFDSDEILNGKELTETKKEQLDEEEQKIKKVKEAINTSIERAQALIEK
ncbi:MAG: hypothetical protein WA810_00725 [Maribacter sp.]